MITTPVSAPPASTHPTAVAERITAIRYQDDELESATIYALVEARMKFSPLQPVRVEPVTKRQRHKVGPLTQAVWNALVYDPETGVAHLPEGAVPLTVVTYEVPVIGKSS